MPFDPTDPKFASPLASITQDRLTGMMNQPQTKVFAAQPQDNGMTTGSPIMPGQTQLNQIMGMAKGGLAQQPDELSGIKNQIRGEFAARGLDFDRFVSNPAVMDEVGKSIQSQGQNGDTILAHINPQEAKILEEMGGSGDINVHTGLPQFYFGDISSYGGSTPSGSSSTSNDRDSSSSNQSPSYSGGASWSGGGNSFSNSGGGSFSDFGGSMVSDGGSMGGVDYNDGGANFGGQNVSSWSGGGNGGGGGFGISGIRPVSFGGGSNETSLSPMGAGNSSISMGEGNQQVAQGAGVQSALPAPDALPGMPGSRASNISGLGQLASVSPLASGLTSFAPTTSGIAPNAGLSDIDFSGVQPSESDLPSPDAIASSGSSPLQVYVSSAPKGNVAPAVVGYDPTNGKFTDANGNQFVPGPTGQRNYTNFSTTSPALGQTIVNAPTTETKMTPQIAAKINPPKINTSAIIPAGSFVKTQDRFGTPVDQATQAPVSTSNLVAALESGSPASQMDAAMTIMGGGANMFGLQGDFTNSTIAETNAKPSEANDIGLMNMMLESQSGLGGSPQLGLSVPSGMTVNLSGQEPRLNSWESNLQAPLASLRPALEQPKPSVGLAPTRAEVPSLPTSPMTNDQLREMGIYKDVLQPGETIRQDFNTAYADATKRGIDIFQWTNPRTNVTSLYKSGSDEANLPARTATTANLPPATIGEQAPPAEYDKTIATLEDAGQIANGMSKEDYAAAMGVPVEEVKTRITTQFGPPMAEYYTKTVLESLAGMTGDKGNFSGAMNLMSLFSPMGILGLGGKALYNRYKSGAPEQNKAEGGYISPLASMGKR